MRAMRVTAGMYGGLILAVTKKNSKTIAQQVRYVTTMPVANLTAQASAGAHQTAVEAVATPALRVTSARIPPA